MSAKRALTNEERGCPGSLIFDFRIPLIMFQNQDLSTFLIITSLGIPTFQTAPPSSSERLKQPFAQLIHRFTDWLSLFNLHMRTLHHSLSMSKNTKLLAL